MNFGRFSNTQFNFNNGGFRFFGFNKTLLTLLIIYSRTKSVGKLILIHAPGLMKSHRSDFGFDLSILGFRYRCTGSRKIEKF